MNLKIAYFYPNELNLYGDRGNIDILKYRAEQRDISTHVITIDTKTEITRNTLKNVDIVFMGGGPDSGQKGIYKDLLNNKAPYIRDYIEKGGVGLFICGSYQLLGDYYKAADESILDGLDIFDIYTQHYGNKYPRIIGNTVAELNNSIVEDPFFKENNYIGNLIVGFENHGGRTFLNDGVLPFGYILKGSGNNGEDGLEGIHYKNCIGSYFHGPILAKNPHIADYLIAKSLKIEKLKKLNDYFITSAHNTALQLKP